MDNHISIDRIILVYIYHINYYILFRHQSGRRQSHEFYSAVKRLVRMSRIFFVSIFQVISTFFGVGWGGGDRAPAPPTGQGTGPGPM